MKKINTYTHKHILKPLALAASLLSVSTASADIRITEIMPSNLSTIVGDLYDYNGYVELYNDGADVDLNGWTVINEKEGKENWRIRLSQSHIIRQGYNLLFFGKKETNSGSAGNVNRLFAGTVPAKLTSDEGKLTLVNGGQQISIAYPKQYPHVSYANGGYMIPTPGEANSAAFEIDNRVKAPTFSGTAPGVVFGNANVQLSTATEGATIYYTLDGSIPTRTNGTVYTSPINISQTTIVRARAYKDNSLYSPVSTGSYLFTNDLYSACGSSKLPIVSISSDNDHFYGNQLGICVKGTNGSPSECSSDMNGNANYNQDWTRPANFEYIIDGKVVNSQEVEVGVFGGCSRSHDVKSFKIKANKKTGSNKFQYTNFFADRTYKKYKSLAVRNGGNGWYLYPRWRDGFMQSLTKGMNIDYQAYQPVAYFINGEYKGLMGLRERTDEDYIYQNYGYDEDEIEYLRVIKGEGYVAQIGTNNAYMAMDRYAQEHNSDADFYDKLSEMMDIDEYIDYQIIQQFVANTDWVNNNIKLWRKKDGGKFRWILFDVDFGMSRHTSVNNNMLLFCTIGNASDNTGNNPGPGGWGGGFGFGDAISTVDQSYCTLFKSCMQNEDFKYHFLDRYTYLLETKFNTQRTAFVLDSISNLTKEEICAMLNYKKQTNNDDNNNNNNNNGDNNNGNETQPGWGNENWGGGIGDWGNGNWGGGIGDWGGFGGGTGNGLGAGSQSEYESGVESMRTFATQRPAIIEDQLVRYYNVQANKAMVNVKLDFGGAKPDYSFMVNKIVQTNAAYSRNLFIGERIKIEVRVPAGYKIQSWNIDGQVQTGIGTTYVGTVGNSGNNIQVSFTKDSEYKIPRLFINEICASNGSTVDEYGSKPDWIEVYNSENYEVDLAGMIVRNVTTGASSVIPYDYSGTVIPAKGHVMLWCDKEPETGACHLDFKLSATAEQTIRLLVLYDGKEQMIDEMSYKLHDRDGSYGRTNDGANDLKLFPVCNSQNNGKAIASPMASNGSITCTPTEIDDVLAGNTIYPNPTTTEWTINVDGEYIVTTIAGQMIESGIAHQGMLIGANYPAGVYMLNINGITRKIVKY